MLVKKSEWFWKIISNLEFCFQPNLHSREREEEKHFLIPEHSESLPLSDPSWLINVYSSKIEKDVPDTKNTVVNQNMSETQSTLPTIRTN